MKECNNCRGLSLLLVVSKVMGKTVIERIRSGVDSKLSNEQAGFKRGKGTTDTNARDCTSFYFYFVDVEKAFESVHRQRRPVVDYEKLQYNQDDQHGEITDLQRLNLSAL